MFHSSNNRSNKGISSSILHELFYPGPLGTAVAKHVTLPELFSVGFTCQLVDLLPWGPVAIFLYSILLAIRVRIQIEILIVLYWALAINLTETFPAKTETRSRCT